MCIRDRKRSCTDGHLEEILQLLRQQTGHGGSGVGEKGGGEALPQWSGVGTTEEVTERARREKMRHELDIGHQRFKNVLCHLISLVHAVGLSTLRDDHNLRNIIVRSLRCLMCCNQ